MKKRTTLLALAFVGGLHSAVFSQAAPKQNLSDLFNSATTSYSGIKAKKEEIKAAQTGYKITKRAYLPEIQFQAQNTFGTYRGAVGGFFPIAGIFNVSGDGIHGNTAVNSLISITAKWDFIQFGKHKDQLKIAKVHIQKAQTRFELKNINIKNSIVQAYLNWQFSIFMLHWSKEEIQRNSTLLEIAKSLVSNGINSAADSLAVKIYLMRAEADKHQWINQMRHFQNQIEALTNLKIDSSSLSPRFLALSNNILLEEKNANTHPLVLLKKEEDNRLDVLQDNINHQALPNISLLAGGMLRGVGFPEQKNVWKKSYELPVNNYLLGLGLTWDIDQFFTKGLKQQRLLHKKRSNLEEQKALKIHLDEERQSLSFEIQQTIEQIENTEKAYVAAKQSYALFKVRYENGLIDLTTLLQIQQSLQFAEQERIKAYYGYWKAQNRYAFVMGDYSVLINQFN